MARLGPQKPDTMKRVFAENGLEEQRPRGKQQGKGSHCVMKDPADVKKATTVPDYPQIDRTLAARMIKQSGKTIKQYLSHLG